MNNKMKPEQTKAGKIKYYMQILDGLKVKPDFIVDVDRIRSKYTRMLGDRPEKIDEVKKGELYQDVEVLMKKYKMPASHFNSVLHIVMVGGK